MAEQTFNLPDLGEGLTEAEVVEWLVGDGDEVVVDQHVVVVETAKATVEVPCPYAGKVSRRHGCEGDVVAVGSPLVTVTQGGADAGPDDAQPDAASADESGSGAVLIGYGTAHERTAPSSGRRAARAAARATRAMHSTHPPVAAATPKVISPIVRKLAADRGIDLQSVQPGPGGVIRRADLDVAAVDGATAPAAAPAPAPKPAPNAAAAAVAAPVIPTTGEERVPLTGIRRAVADKLSQSRREIPDATTWVDADATGLVEARRTIGLERAGILALLGRICVAGLHRFPELNSSVDTERAEIVRHGAVNLGFAADSPRGLVVPVIPNANRLTTRELASRMGELVDGAREGTLKPADLTGGTFTLNNYGVFGVDGSTPIINHPEAAMLGVGRIIDRPWVVDGELTVRKVVQLGLSFDHRVCDGGVAGGFLRFVADAVERPLQLLGDV
ncbi:dihydrolipoamide acetyltransferase family protein [Flexivirga meconopsidis]|uniref:dihydrolipoamide acetyltransferase family protein n=1 Tax=Flexivirga meconopsidis TaxID=2977121 RepID=UPI00223F18CE|nr:dihydrolipoamide acetyltransferase family protein [Flexivirga meconopsidis]